MMNLFKKLFKSKSGSPQYDMNSLDGINQIQIPKYEQLQGMGDPSGNIEYILQKKATEHKRNGRMDLAIACLRKSNEIFPHSNFSWPKKDYLRLVEYLKLDRQFDAARIEEQKINKLFESMESDRKKEAQRINKEIYGDCDIVSTNETYFVCSECAKYIKRYFSISGKNKKYPKLPEYLLTPSPEHKYCAITLYPVLDNVSEPAWNYTGNFVKYCNRPFVDERTLEQRKLFDKEVAEKEELALDKEFYDLIFEKFPDIAPKSFGGYRRMKASNSENYQQLLKKAKECLEFDFYSQSKK